MAQKRTKPRNWRVRLVGRAGGEVVESYLVVRAPAAAEPQQLASLAAQLAGLCGAWAGASGGTYDAADGAFVAGLPPAEITCPEGLGQSRPPRLDDILGAQLTILRRMPLGGKLGMRDRQRLLGRFCLLQLYCHTPTSTESTYLDECSARHSAPDAFSSFICRYRSLFSA
jgi:hypothetical protein